MKNVILGVLDSVRIWFSQFWPRQKIATLLDWFDLNVAKNITENDLQQILHYNFTKPEQTFFIIWWSDNQEDGQRKFSSEHIEQCYQSAWYALIRPNDSSYIILPWERICIQFNGKGQYVKSTSDGRMWEKWWWAFQLDKNTGKILLCSPVWWQKVLELCEYMGK